MSVYLRHQQCPKCAEIGRDTSRDNMAVYKDGSTWCFSCGYRESANVIALPEPKTDINLPFLVDDLPTENQAYLERYLTPEEIKTFKFKYAPAMGRHVYYVQDGNKIFYEARSVIKGKPKSLQFGEKPYHLLGNPADGSDTIVLVEDILSAIVVGRYFSALPLFGSHLPPDWVSNLIKPGFPRRIVVWLDSDKTKEAIDIARSISMFKECLIIQTPQDPKDSGDVVKELVTDPYLVFQNTKFAGYLEYGT